ncbi:hypothetical protein C8T65DRAFT_643621 [Cerioporus squamosus]|nr:hypothetical protein C8T65DRAFT_643621 [Cerioporus squamosus]
MSLRTRRALHYVNPVRPPRLLATCQTTNFLIVSPSFSRRPINAVAGKADDIQVPHTLKTLIHIPAPLSPHPVETGHRRVHGGCLLSTDLCDVPSVASLHVADDGTSSYIGGRKRGHTECVQTLPSSALAIATRVSDCGGSMH